jgi:hypothetical protein
MASQTHVRPFIGTKKTKIWVSLSPSKIDIVVTLPSQKTFSCEFSVGKILSDFDGERVQDWRKKHSSGTLLHFDNATLNWAS